MLSPTLKSGGDASPPSPTDRRPWPQCVDIAQAQPRNPGPSCVSTSDKGNLLNSAVVKAVAPTVNARTGIHASNYKNVFLLFVITFVFISCWMSIWVALYLDMPIGLVESLMIRIYVANSVVNPYLRRRQRHVPEGRETVLPADSR